MTNTLGQNFCHCFSGYLMLRSPVQQQCGFALASTLVDLQPDPLTWALTLPLFLYICLVQCKWATETTPSSLFSPLSAGICPARPFTAPPRTSVNKGEYLIALVLSGFALNHVSFAVFPQKLGGVGSLMETRHRSLVNLGLTGDQLSAPVYLEGARPSSGLPSPRLPAQIV